ncbi:hypothetical protein NKH69_34120 [Mesorhizobium sp. M0976]|uniref:cytidylyltransferase domain-containing protein n=1 Tax=Mesorhizobium sp. M0976 TaxID=2957038 RepID=UPI003337FF21
MSLGFGWLKRGNWALPLRWKKVKLVPRLSPFRASSVHNALAAGTISVAGPEAALPTGSDRAFAAASLVDTKGKYDVIVVLQGDLPTIDPATVRTTLTPLAREAQCAIATLATEIEDPLELHAPQVVKIALAIHPGKTIGRAVYSRRAAIPAGTGKHYHHVGMYTYRREALRGRSTYHVAFLNSWRAWSSSAPSKLACGSMQRLFRPNRSE